MRRAVLVYAVLLLGALGGAYYTWTHEAGPDLGEAVVVLPGEPDELESVVYKSEKIELTMTMKEDELGRYAWVRAVPRESEEETEERAKPDDPHAPPPDDGEVAEFKAGAAVDTVIEGLAPFMARRPLDGIGDDKLEELGLAEPDATLTIAREGREPKTYELGGSVFGGSNVYVRDPGSGKVYVVDAKLVRPLQTGKRTLPDRNLIGLQTKDIKTLSVRTGGGTASFEQHNPADPQAVYWSTAGESEASSTGAAWIDKVLRLRASRYVQAGQEPRGLEEAYTYAVQGADGKTTTVDVFRAQGDDGEEHWYARSGHTRGMVELHRSLAAETAADLASALGGAPPADAP